MEAEIKTMPRKIEITDLPHEIPDFTSSYEPKDSLIKKWIINWILSAVSKNKIKENDIIPSKTDLSKYLGVSVGTVQNAIRYVEDEGLLKSKQKIGTMISNVTNPSSDMIKSTSRRDKAILAIKKFIIQKDFSLNKSVPSTRKMSEILGISQNTTRLAYEYLCKEGILESKQSRGNDSNWILKNYPQVVYLENRNTDVLKADTLVDKLTIELKKYFASKYAIGDKIPSHEYLASELNVSVKTIHDSITKLSSEGILISRRGRYGTILAKNPLERSYEPLKENSIFSKAEDAAFYSYQKIESQIINLITKKYKIGDKLPSMKDLSKEFDVSTNTIRKAMNSLAGQGYLTFSRGRFGGTFIVDTPIDYEKQTYQWLSINPNYI